ncbi:MAG TPA: hypothetical protein PK299_05935 [Anaerolineales bacterium]|nr:hypothetical protein [Anaerolineales bacterium]
MRPQNFAMRRHPSFNRFLLLLGVVICLLAGWLLRQENYPGRYYLLSSAEIAQQPLPWVRVTRQGEQVFAEIYDRQPWAYVRLEVNGKPATALGYNTLEADRLYHWRWQLTADTLATPSQLSFFHTCQLGCQAWAVQHIGMPPPITEPRPYRPTQLGAVFASPQRNWHGRQAWSVEMTYAQLPDDETWGVDALAERVRLLHSNGLQVLVRGRVCAWAKLATRRGLGRAQRIFDLSTAFESGCAPERGVCLDFGQ